MQGRMERRKRRREDGREGEREEGKEIQIIWKEHIVVC